MTTRRGFLRGLGALVLAPVALKFVEQRVEEPKPLARAEDGRITTYFQQDVPSAQIGDIWFNTATAPFELHRFDGRTWVPLPKF